MDIPEAQARYAGVGSPVSGARRIVVDQCPYCGRSHAHTEVIGVPDDNQRMADCFIGEYRLVFSPLKERQ